jgi:hypothetical protein
MGYHPPQQKATSWWIPPLPHQYHSQTFPSVVNSFSIVNSFAVVSSPKDKCISWPVQTGKWHLPIMGICPQSGLSGKALYLRLSEYWSHLTQLDLGISSIIMCTECPMLYNKTLSIKSVNHLSPSCKDCPEFSTICLYDLEIALLHEDWGFCGHRPLLSLLFFFFFLVCLFFPFPFNKTLLFLFNLCLCPVLCSRDSRTWDVLYQGLLKAILW